MEELEKAHVYIEQLHKRVEIMEEETDALKAENVAVQAEARSLKEENDRITMTLDWLATRLLRLEEETTGRHRSQKR